MFLIFTHVLRLTFLSKNFSRSILASLPTSLSTFPFLIKIKNLKVHQDIPDVQERITKTGFLMEVLRDDDDLLSKFGQSTFTVAYKDTIKAFHWHEKQDDLWFVASGSAIIVLHDLRNESSSYGFTDTIS